MGGRQYAVLGPLESGVETRGFLGCEVLDGLPRSDLPVVVLWVPEDVGSDPRRLGRLLRETAFVTRLEHPNLLRVHGLERYQEGWARITAYADGEPLSVVLDRAHAEDMSIGPTIAARIVLDLASAVHHAHEQGSGSLSGRPIVHGGLRPDTVLVGFDGHSKVGGYGASVLSVEDAETAATRTAYLAPEQVIGGQATASVAADVYALGAILHTMLAGVRPFADAEDVEAAVMSTPPAELEADGLAARLAAVARRAMSKRGAERPNSARTFSAEVRSALKEEEVSPASPGAIAELMENLLPVDGPHRSARSELLETANEPDAVTALVPSDDPVEGIDAELCEAARPAPRQEPQEAETVVVRAAAQAETLKEAPLLNEARASAEATSPSVVPIRSSSPPVSNPVPAPAASQAATEDLIRGPHAAPQPMAHASYPYPGPAPAPSTGHPQGGVPISGVVTLHHGQMPATGGWSAPVYPPAAAWGAPPPGAYHPAPASGFVPRSGVQAPLSGQAVPMPMGPHGGWGTAPTTGQSFLADAQAEAALSNQPVQGLPPSTPRKAPGRNESRITQFNKKAGDGSRSLLFLVVVAAFGLLLFTVLSSEPPEGISEAPKDTSLDRSLVQEVLSEPSADPDDEPKGSEGAAPAAGDGQESGGATSEAKVATQGTVWIQTNPPVDVFYDGERLGRTPLRVTLDAGRQRLRLTDRQTGINVYRGVSVSGDREARIEHDFETAQLLVNAPAGARISLNGQFLADAPMKKEATIYEGSYVLKVNYQGMRWTERFEATPGNKISFDVEVESR